jgi:hypothetical protein
MYKEIFSTTPVVIYYGLNSVLHRTYFHILIAQDLFNIIKKLALQHSILEVQYGDNAPTCEVVT